MQKHEAVAAKRKDIFINNFLGGIAWALGTTIGFSVVVAILGVVLKQLGVLPVIGTVITQAADFFSMGTQQ